MNQNIKKLLVLVTLLVIVVNQLNYRIGKVEANVNEDNTTTKNTQISTQQLKTNSQLNQQLLTSGSVVTVSNYADFKNALQDPSVEEVNVISDITDSPTGDIILSPVRDVKIIGNNHLIDLNTSYIKLDSIADSSQYQFTLNDANLVNTNTNGFIYADTNNESWSINLNNITTNSITEKVVNTLKIDVNLGGNNNVNSYRASITAANISFLKNSYYQGVISSNGSILSLPKASNKTRIMRIEDGATVKLTANKNNGSFATIHEFQEINIASGATLEIASPANQLIFVENSSLTIEKGGTFRGIGAFGYDLPVLKTSAYDGKNASINVKEGAYFYVSGNTGATIINMTYPGNKITISKPAAFDISNRDSSGQAVNLSASDATFTISNSDLSVWKKGTSYNGPPTFSWYNASLTANNLGIPIQASNGNLLTNYKGNNYLRISSIVSNPIINLNELTDADKKLTGNVTVSGTPAAQVDVTAINNQDSVTSTTISDDNGNFSIPLGKFYKAGTTFTVSGSGQGHATANPQKTIVVKDVTPPTPATIHEPVGFLSHKISGLSDEPGASVTAIINGVNLSLANKITVGSDGKWEIPLSTTLHEGDIIQVFLTDTNQNKNPVVDTVFRDATFLKATTTVVVDETPPTGEPVNMILNVGDQFPSSANPYVKNVNDSSGETLGNGITASFIQGSIPTTDQVGRYTVDVLLVDSTSLSSIITVPVFIKDESTTVSDEYALRATDIILNLNDITGLSSNEINQLILTKSLAQGWNITTGEDLSNQISVFSTTINQTSEGDYTATLQLNGISHMIHIKVIEHILKFNSIPENIVFQPTIISSITSTIHRDESNWDFSVFDNRGVGGKWIVTASITSPLTSTVNPAHKMLDALVFVDKDHNTTPLSETPLKIFDYTTGNDSIIPITWSTDKGILIKTNFHNVFAEPYTTTINWTLIDAP